MVKRQKRRPGNKSTISQLLAIRPNSQQQEIVILLRVYTLVQESAKNTYSPRNNISRSPDALTSIMLGLLKKKAIPTEDDEFALLLDAIFSSETPREYSIALNNARSYIVRLVQWNQTEVQRYWGKRGGRGRKKNEKTKSLRSSVARIVLEKIRKKPARVEYPMSRFLPMIATETPGYGKFSKTQQKNRRDSVRTILVRPDWLKVQVAE